jgi:hypothetical protein
MFQQRFIVLSWVVFNKIKLIGVEIIAPMQILHRNIYCVFTTRLCLTGLGMGVYTTCPMGCPMGDCGFAAGIPRPKLIFPIMTIFSGQTKTRRSGFLNFLDPTSGLRE